MNEMRVCTKCGIEKNISEFVKRGASIRSVCKACANQKSKEYRKNNPEKIKSNNVKYYNENKQEINSQRAIYMRNLRRTNVSFRIRSSISRLILQSITKNSSKNRVSSTKYLLYTLDELKDHLEKQFEPWMNWINYKMYNPTTWDDNDPNTWTWNIDHIIPQADLPYTSMEDENFQKCWALENLRPLSSKQNFLDGVNRTRHKKVA